MGLGVQAWVLALQWHVLTRLVSFSRLVELGTVTVPSVLTTKAGLEV